MSRSRPKRSAKPRKPAKGAAAEPAHPAPPRVGVAVSLAAGAEGDPARLNLLESVERGVRLGGAEPVRLRAFGVPAADGAARSLALRDLLADELECLAGASGVDGLVLVAESNDGAAGLLLGAARLNKPALLAPARGLPAPDDRGEDYPACHVFLLAEAMGLTLPGAATAPAGSAEQAVQAEAAGRRAAELAAQGFSVRRVLMSNAFLNGARADAAFGGLPASALFLLALAQESGVKLSLDAVAEVGRDTPEICRLYGPKGHRLADLHAAGGVAAVLAALKGQWLPHSTVSGRGINELAKAARVKDPRVVRPRGGYREAGGLMVLRGNLAPQGALLRPDDDVFRKPPVFSGVARVFDSREALLAALAARKVAKGDVVVLRYEGPRGGPGLRPLTGLRGLVAAQGLAGHVALFTDGAWGGSVGEGLALEMASPEAVEPSALSVVRDGDRVTIDVPARRVNVHLTDTDTKVRLARWQAPAPRARNGFFARYVRSVTSAAEGAVLK
jgi:dihydroxy-acid dehydratase